MLYFYGSNSLTLGTAGSLDFLWPGDDLDADKTLSTGDIALVCDYTNSRFRIYIYDVLSSEAESSPSVIKAVSNTGNGRWLQFSSLIETSDVLNLVSELSGKEAAGTAASLLAPHLPWTPPRRS